jgi:hypothetical protein
LAKKLLIPLLLFFLPLAVRAECLDIDGLVLWGTVEAVSQGADPYLVAGVWWNESKGDLHAIGQANELGAWQMKWPTYLHLCEEMGREPSMLDFVDTRAQTEVAVYGLSHGYEGWWTTYGMDIPDWLRDKVDGVREEL